MGSVTLSKILNLSEPPVPHVNDENNRAYTRRCSVPSTGYPFPFLKPQVPRQALLLPPPPQAGLTSTWECTTRALGALGNVRLPRKALAELLR